LVSEFPCIPVVVVGFLIPLSMQAKRQIYIRWQI